MLISLIKSLICLSFFILLWVSGPFRVMCAGYFNRVEEVLASRKRLLILSALGIYIIITLLLQTHHGIDGDEGQAWLIARDQGSLSRMYSMISYEGTPALWHTILAPFARSGAPFSIIYFLNYFFLLTAIACWLFYAPFPLLLRILLPFAHIFLTEYSVNARSYALSTCLLFVSLTLYRNYYRKWFLWALGFFLLANTNIHSAILVCGFAMFLFLDWIFMKNNVAARALLVIGAGILLVIAQVYPPADLDTTLAAIRFQSPLNLITVSVVSGAEALSGLIYFTFLAQAVASVKNRFQVYALIAVQAVLFFFFIYKYHGQVRHHFFLFLSILMSLWVGEVKNKYRPITNLFLLAIMVMMITASIPIAIRNWHHPTTYKKEMADYIKEDIKTGSRTFVACHPDNMTGAVLPYLPHTFFYMPDPGRWGSFVIWDQKRKSVFAPTIRNVLDLRVTHPNYNKYFYLSIFALPADSADLYNIRLLKKCTDPYLASIANPWNTYYLYRLPDR